MKTTNKILLVAPMLEAFVTGEDRSIEAAGRIEVALDDAFPDDDEIQEYVTMFASYRPEGGDYLYNEDQMAARPGTPLHRPSTPWAAP